MRRPLCVIFLLLLALLSSYFQFNDIDYKYSGLNGRRIDLSGKIIGKEFRTNYEGVRVLDLYMVLEDSKDKVKLSVSENADKLKISIGMNICINGEAACFRRASNYGEFDPYIYNRIEGTAFCVNNPDIIKVYGREDIFREGLFRVREYIYKLINRCFNEKDTAVICAVLLGDRSLIDEDLKVLYQRSGIIHVLSISGLHISILGMGIYKILSAVPVFIRNKRKIYIPKWFVSVICIFFMYAYGSMCGRGTSSLRAIFMFTLKLLAPLIGRTYDMISALSFCGIMILAEQPLYVKHGGFIMSFLAVLALGMLFPCLKPENDKDEKKNNKILSLFYEGVIASLCISIVTLPAYMCFYYSFPLYSVFINPVVIPLMSLMLPFSIAAVIFMEIFSPLSVIFAYPVHLILEFYELVCRKTVALPISTWYAGSPEVWQTAAYYLILIVFVIYYNRHRKNKVGKYNNIIKCVILSLAFLIISYRISPELKITVLDIGQGDSLVVRCRDKCFLIDGGSTTKFSVGKYQMEPYLKYEGIDQVDAAIISHSDLDHISGVIEMIESSANGGIPIKQLVLPDIDKESKNDNYLRLEEAASKHNIAVTYLHTGENWEVPVYKNESVKFECLSPYEGMNTGDPNEMSIVLEMTYGKFNMLLTGDVGGEGLEAVKDYLKTKPGGIKEIRILKVAHHGSHNNTDEEFLELYAPGIAIISCGERNIYGHPHKEVLDMLGENNIETYITSKSGCVCIEIKNGRTYLKEYRE